MTGFILLFAASGFFLNTALATTTPSLSTSPEWHALLHYFDSSSSDILERSPFFLASDGYKNPENELNQTIQSLGDPHAAPIGPMQVHPYCAFPARRRFLEQHGYSFPKRACPELDELIQSIAPESLSLVFSTHYAGNPASLFGHTLIRINRADGARLRDYSVNYAADIPPNEIGLKYVPFGLLGLYPGFFQIAPYYMKVLEYNEAESRDLWEFKLSYTPEETRYWLEHLFEVRWLAKFRYSFLKQNCSYQVNRLLQVVRPRDGSLIPAWTFYTLPSESVRILKLHHPGLIGQIDFRPSHRRILRHQLAELDSSERKRLEHLLEDPVRFASEESNARVLETAIQKTEYQKIEQQEGSSNATKNALRALRTARARLPAGSSFSAPPRPVDPTNQPDLTHGNKMASVGYVQGSGFDSEWSVRVRPLLHDRMDRDEGIDPSFSLTGLDLEITRRSTRSPRYRVRRFEFLKLESWEAFQTGDYPFSWGLFSGFVPFDEPRSPLQASNYFKTQVDVGSTVPLFSPATTLTGLISGNVSLDSEIEKKRTLSLPASLWLNHRFGPRFKVAGFAELRTPASFQAPSFAWGGELSYFVWSESSIRLSAKKIERSFVYQTEGALWEGRWGVFF